jgi:DNA repair protein RadC
MQLRLFELPTITPHPVWFIADNEKPDVFISHAIDAKNQWFRHVPKCEWFHAGKEHLVTIALDVRGKMRGIVHISTGSLCECIAHPREIFQPMILASAHRFVLMHNHPSGDTSPSDADRRLTHRIKDIGHTMQMDLSDHVIVGARQTDNPFSFREAGLL